MRRAVSLALVLLIVAGGVAILAPAQPVAAAGQIEVYKTGLNFPIALAFSSDGRIFFAEKATGNIRIIYLANRTLLPTPFITLPSTDGTGERGLLGLALDPGFPSTPYVYAYQTYNDVTNGTTYNRIVRIIANGNVGISYIVILRLPPLSSATYHNGGVIGFGPDGKLYAVVGENANPSLSQDPLSPLGKVLRMEPNGSPPPDNPFYNNPSWFNLTYTYGHRNMFGLAFHPITGRVYVTENGPACNDEVNLLIAGDNYGWGPNNTCSTPPPPPNNTNQDGPSPVLPIWWWGTTICPTNAAIYRGPYFPTWRGDLFMGDCNTGRFHRLHLVPPNYDSVASDDILWTAPTSIIAVAAGPDGAFWLTTPSTIYRYWDSGQPPIASFTATPNPAIVSSPVAFDASGSSDPDGNIVSYAWNFGDSTGASGVSVAHTYLTFGTFNATLTVTDNESFMATAYRHIVVRAPPIASFTATPSPAVVGASVTFDASGSHDPDGAIVSYRWDFGDLTNGSGAITTHPYTIVGTFNVTLNVTDNNALNGTAYHDVIVQPAPPGPQPPVADFTVNPLRVNPGVPVTFDASTSFDPDGMIVSYTWEFGDSTGGTGVVATHAYANPGVFSVNLSVIDNQALSSSATHQVTVNARPHAAFQFAPTTVYVGISVTFDASTSTDPDGSIASYAWNFGDGSSGTGVQASHVFAAKGTFGIRLTVVDSDGLSNETTRTLAIPDRAPQITSSTPGVDPLTIDAGATQTFTVIAWDPDGDVLMYTWRVDGDAAGGNLTALNFASTTPGAHTVNVTVADGSLVASREWTVTVVAAGYLALVTSWPFLAFVLAVIVAVLLVWWFRRKRKMERPPRSTNRGTF